MTVKTKCCGLIVGTRFVIDGVYATEKRIKFLPIWIPFNRLKRQMVFEVTENMELETNQTKEKT